VNRKYSINGVIYEYDMDHMPISDAMMIKVATGLNVKPLTDGIRDFDPACLQAFGWLLLTRAKVKGADGQPVKLADVDFDMLAFFVEEDEPEPDSEADPTPGEALPGGVTPDSTSPEPSTTTA
jgi:hypothetical protein